MESRVELNRKTGSKTLIVYYSGNRYDEAIEAAEKKLGLENSRIAVIALHEGSPVFRRFPAGSGGWWKNYTQ